VNEPGLPCRRCGQVSRNGTVIYGRDKTGGLVPKSAQCTPRCPDRVRQGPGRSSSPRTMTMTARRPGLCPACGRDIIPGDVLARDDGKTVHYECSGPGSSEPEPRRRERVRTVSTRGVSV